MTLQEIVPQIIVTLATGGILWLAHTVNNLQKQLHGLTEALKVRFELYDALPGDLDSVRERLTRVETELEVSQRPH